MKMIEYDSSTERAGEMNAVKRNKIPVEYRVRYGDGRLTSHVVGLPLAFVGSLFFLTHQR